MKNLFVISILILSLAACGNESEDPSPKFDCEELKENVDKTRKAFNLIINNAPPDNATQAAKDEHKGKATAAEKAYRESVEIFSKNCQ